MELMIKTTSIVIILIVAVLLIYLFPRQAINPGDLSKGHQHLENDCMKCHTFLVGTTGEKCIACHKPADIGKFLTSGEKIEAKPGKSRTAFHQLFTKDSCLSCHTDHSGRDVTNTVRAFSHSLLQGEDLNQCRSCHQAPADNLHRKNNQECSRCHTVERWLPGTLDHARYFRFDKHHGPDCLTCHQNNNYSEYTCYGCHEHSPWKIREEHLEEGISNYQNCAPCHPSADEDEAKRIFRSGAYQDGSWNRLERKDYNRQEGYGNNEHINNNGAWHEEDDSDDDHDSDDD